MLELDERLGSEVKVVKSKAKKKAAKTAPDTSTQTTLCDKASGCSKKKK